MQFYEGTNNQGICQEIDRLCDTTDTEYPRIDKTSRVNNAYEEIVGDLINVDGRWQFDDSNYTTLPIGLATLVNAQTSYSFTSDFLDIEAVNVLDENGQYRKLKPIDHKQFGDQSIEEYFGITTSTTPTGMPEYYDKWEDTIKLYPAPDDGTSVTLANGLKVYFKRTANLFTVASDTSADTTEPGFASPWHVLLAYKAAIPYCQTYKKDRVAWLTNEAVRMRDELKDHYSRRTKDERQIIKPKLSRFI